MRVVVEGGTGWGRDGTETRTGMRHDTETGQDGALRGSDRKKDGQGMGRDWGLMGAKGWAHVVKVAELVRMSEVDFHLGDSAICARGHLLEAAYRRDLEEGRCGWPNLQVVAERVLLHLEFCGIASSGQCPSPF